MRITFQSNVGTEHLNGCCFYTHMKAGDIMPDKDFDKKIEQMNIKVAEIICSIGVSMITAIVTVILYTRL